MNTPIEKKCEACEINLSGLAPTPRNMMLRAEKVSHQNGCPTQNTTDKKCCDLCDSNSPSQVEYCDECPCHTTDKGWEVRFAELYVGLPVMLSLDELHQIKDFIRREIQQKGEEEYERGRKDAVEFIRASENQHYSIDEGYMVIPTSALEAALEAQKP